MKKFYNLIGKIVVFATIYGLSIFATYKTMIFILNHITVYR